METYETYNSESADLEKEQRREKGEWVFFGVFAMLFVVGSFYLDEIAEQRLLFFYVLTALCYGYHLYIEGFEQLRSNWMWKAALAIVPIHTAYIWILALCDVRWRFLPAAAYSLMYLALFTALPEIALFSLILALFRRQAEPMRLRRSIKQTVTRAVRPKRPALGILTTLDEDSDDLEKPVRRRTLNVILIVVSFVLFSEYFLVGSISRRFALYIVQFFLLALFTYGRTPFVDRKDDVGAKWMWTAFAVTLPIHISAFGVVVAIDRMEAGSASNPAVYLISIWLISWVEAKLFESIIDDCRPLSPATS